MSKRARNIPMEWTKFKLRFGLNLLSNRVLKSALETIYPGQAVFQISLVTSSNTKVFNTLLLQTLGVVEVAAIKNNRTC